VCALSKWPFRFGSLQLRDRDAVKDALQQVLPKFKKKVNQELEERHRLLSDNPSLLQLYKDLVSQNGREQTRLSRSMRSS